MKNCFGQILFIILLSGFAHCQMTSFMVPIEYKEPSMGTGALTGMLYYDWNYGPNNPSYYLDFPNQSYAILFQHNYNRGYSFSNGQWRYTYGPGCPGGCETGAISGGMPRLFVDSSYTTSGATQTVKGLSCTVYVPTNTTNNPVQRLLVQTSVNPQRLCEIQLTNGNTITTLSTLSSLSSATASTKFTPGLGCSCGKPIDISLVIDRSGSISVNEFKQLLDFLNEFISKFTISPKQIQIAITTYNKDATNILSLSNSPQAVYNAINAMTCKKDRTGDSSCIDGATSISQGIQVGSRELRPSLPAVRPHAAKLMLITTDGAHNTLADGDETWCYQECGKGQPLNTYTGPPFYDTCGDRDKDFVPDDWQPYRSGRSTSEFARCLRDLINAREFAYKTVGDDLIIYTLGIGNLISKTELNIVTNNQYKIPGTKQTLSCTGGSPTARCLSNNFVPCNGNVSLNCYKNDNTNPERVILSSSWDALGSTILELTSSVCDSNAQPCTGCCGFCKCGTCTPPDSCSTTNFCDVGVLKGSCCGSTPRVCAPSNPCVTATCDRTANNGNGGCVETPIQCQAPTECYTYACVDGSCRSTLRAAPATDKCHISDCINGVLFNNAAKNCSGSDACVNYACNPADGSCIATPKPFPANPHCKEYLCDPADTDGNPFYLRNITCPQSTDKCLPRFCNPNNGQCEVQPRVCNDPTNLCDLTTCDPTTGNCNTQTFKTCTAPNCKTNCTCVPTTGECQCKDVQCQSDTCIPQTCNVANGNCENDFETCPAGCENANCGAKNNQCWKFACDSNITDESRINNCDLVTYTGDRCASLAEDSCKTNVACVNETGCVYDSIICNPETAPPCKDWVRNSTFPGCCMPVPHECPTDPCANVVCNPETGLCDYTPICPSSDVCVNRGCENGLCWARNVTCDSPDPCFTVKECVVTSGGCIFEPVPCDDNNLCTDEYCTNGVCVYQNRTCDDENPCTLDSCDLGTGLCVFTPRTCDDADPCTDDYCNPSSSSTDDPCVHDPIDPEICNDNNLCTDDMCVPFVGCRNVDYNVTERCNVTDPCAFPVCLPTYGCATESRICELDSNGRPYEVAYNPNSSINYQYDNTSSDCSYAVCQQNYDTMTHQCIKIETSCASFAIDTTIIATLTTAAIVGIIVAAVIVAGACGGGAFAAYNKYVGDGEGAIISNPLYENMQRGGDNPLCQPDG